MKEMLHELVLAIRLIGEGRFAEAYKAMARVGRIQAVMTLSWDVLSTLTPVDYRNSAMCSGRARAFSPCSFAKSNIGSVSKTTLISNIMIRARPNALGSRLRSMARAFAKRQPRRCLAPALTLAMVGRGARRRVAESLPGRRALVRAVRTGRETGRHRRRARNVAAQARAHRRADHRQQARHRRLRRRVLPALDARQARVSRIVVAEDRSLSFKGLFSRALAPIPDGCTSPLTAITCGRMRASTAKCRRGTTPPGLPTASGTR